MSQIAELLTESTGEALLKTFEFYSFQSEHKDYVLNSLDLEDTDVESIRPCSPAQLGMLADFINSNGDLYCNRLVLKVKEDVDIYLLQDAWSKAMAHHEMLRTPRNVQNFRGLKAKLSHQKRITMTYEGHFLRSCICHNGRSLCVIHYRTSSLNSRLCMLSMMPNL